MTIKLISEQEYDFLVDCQKKYPNLTYENKGWDVPNKNKWENEEMENFKKCEDIIKKSIVGFVEFNHFKTSKKGEILIRFQYDWTADEPNRNMSFTGVGYLSLEELYKGFKT